MLIFQNGPVERGHQTVATSVHALLFGSGLSVKFWLYEFFHFLCIQNALWHKGQTASHLFLATGKKDNLKKLRTFGYRVYV